MTINTYIFSGCSFVDKNRYIKISEFKIQPYLLIDSLRNNLKLNRV